MAWERINAPGYITDGWYKCPHCGTNNLPYLLNSRGGKCYNNGAGDHSCTGVLDDDEVPHKEESVTTVKKVDVIEIVYHDGPILLPEGLSYAKAAQELQRRADYDNEDVSFAERMPVFVWDGAVAMEQAIREQFGIAMQIETPGFFGPEPPKMIAVEIGVDQTRQVPWGRFSLPGVTGYVATGFQYDQEGRVNFNAQAKVKRRFEAQIKRLFARTREIATHNSIYKGKALTVKFRSPDKAWLDMPAVSFYRIVDNPPIFSRDLERAIETNILTPIRYTQIARDNNIPLKRGILLAGVYGTGKTLTAAMIAQVAPPNGWTFIYVPEVEELERALKFAQLFSPAVVFCEDVDRIAGIDRTDQANDLLNVLDGVDTKTSEIMTVLTSNHAENINPALRRKGRIDVTIEVRTPDAEAVERLVRHYGGPLIAPDEDLSKVGLILQGSIPALIRETVERAKLAAIDSSGGTSLRLGGQDLAFTAQLLIDEEQLFKTVGPTSDAKAAAIGGHMLEVLSGKYPVKHCTNCGENL